MTAAVFASPTPAVTTHRARFIGKCKACKACARIEVSYTVRRGMGDWGRTRTTVVFTLPNGQVINDGHESSAYFHTPCFCGAVKWGLRVCVQFKKMHGIRAPHIKCNAKCVAATGPNCECSCGGENHGHIFGA